MPKLHLQTPTPTIQGYRWMSWSNICLRFSTSPSSSVCGLEGQADVSHPHSDSSNLGPTTMVHHTTRSFSSATQKSSPKPRSSRSESWRSQAPKSKGTQPCDLAPEFIELGYLNLPPQCMAILKEACKPTTRACYAVKWKRFVFNC